MSEVIETNQADIEEEQKAAIKAAKKAAFAADESQAKAVDAGRKIVQLKEELEQLEQRQELYRRVVGPKAIAVARTWHTSFETAERSFIKFLQDQHVDKKQVYLDLSSPGAQWYFNKEEIKDELIALAYEVVGYSAMREYAPNDKGYYPVVPRMIEVRAALAELTGN